MHIYLLPGLGNTPEIFENLNIKGDSIHYMKWIEPLDNKETYDSYCKRLTTQIKHDEDVVLIGFSFGGITVQQIATFRKIEKVIILSSLKSDKEKGAFFNFMKHIPIYKMHNLKMAKATAPIWRGYFGLPIEFEDKWFNMMAQHSVLYFKWSVNKIVNWTKAEDPTVYHIHGDQDRIFETKYLNKTNRTFIIKGATHLMPVYWAKEVSDILNDILKPVEVEL